MTNSMTNRQVLRSVVFSCLLIAASNLAFSDMAFGQAETTPTKRAGLVAYNQIRNELGGLPVGVVYIRGDFRKAGQPYLWPVLEPRPGEYNFSSIVAALDAADRLGVKLGLRIMTAHPHVARGHPEHPFFPEWIAFNEVRRDGKTGLVFSDGFDERKARDVRRS